MKDFQFAFHTLRNNPTFTLIVMATLGIGIGINTARLIRGLLYEVSPLDPCAQGDTNRSDCGARC